MRIFDRTAGVVLATTAALILVRPVLADNLPSVALRNTPFTLLNIAMLRQQDTTPAAPQDNTPQPPAPAPTPAPPDTPPATPAPETPAPATPAPQDNSTPAPATPAATTPTQPGTTTTWTDFTPGLVMVPLGTTTIEDVTTSDPQFSIFNKLIKLAGFDQTLANRGPMTVFAPTDAAWQKLPPGTLDMLQKPENIAMLQAVLMNHFLPGQYLSTDVGKLNGQTVPTTLMGSSVSLSNTSGFTVNNVNVVRTDVGAKNGAIEVVDTVLMPPPSYMHKNDGSSLPDMTIPAKDKDKDKIKDPIKEQTTKPTTPVP